VKSPKQKTKIPAESQNQLPSTRRSKKGSVENIAPEKLSVLKEELFEDLSRRERVLEPED